MNVVIVAGGLGSRLAPYTNFIPKFFINTGKESGYVQQINYWRKYTSAPITIVVHPAYADMVQAYHDIYFDTPIIIKTVDKANGSAHAIMSTCEHLVNQPALFTWCDVLPKSEITVPLQNTIFTNDQFDNRYNFRNNEIVKETGNVFGIYFVKDFQLKPFTDMQDFIDIVSGYGEFVEQKVPEIYDWGDMPKLKQTIKQIKDGARSFNSLQITEKSVIKQALCAQGEALIKREGAWYAKVSELNNPASVARVVNHSDGKLELLKVNGKTVYEFVKQNPHKLYNLQHSCFDALSLLHSAKTNVSKDIILADVKKEAFTKLMARYDEIKKFINAFGEVNVVNNVRLRFTPEEYIYKLHNILNAHYAAKDVNYCLIHGDPQFSNMMVDQNENIVLIDPRGYFGNTEFYGLADYDYAKMYYALSGYDEFNSELFGIQNYANDELQFTVNGQSDLSSYIIKVWVAICWIGLAQYIKNDPVKCVCAHYHGLSLAQQLL